MFDWKSAINRARAEQGATLDELAERAGVNIYTLRTILYADHSPSIDKLDALFEALGMKLDYRKIDSPTWKGKSGKKLIEIDGIEGSLRWHADRLGVTYNQLKYKRSRCKQSN